VQDAADGQGVEQEQARGDAGGNGLLVVGEIFAQHEVALLGDRRSDIELSLGMASAVVDARCRRPRSGTLGRRSVRGRCAWLTMRPG
jgi:hypothetical protein